MTILPADLKKIEKAFKSIEANVKDEIEELYKTRCPSCGSNILPLSIIWDRDNNSIIELRLQCSSCGEKHRKKADQDDVEKLRSIELMEIKHWYPKDTFYLL